ncbi:hypothetical protein ATERTT37_000817 [Aspergillus terreus]
MPKRASSDSAGPAKKAKTGSSTKRNQRWSSVSASANVAAVYKELVEKDPAHAYSYICLCRSIIDDHQDDDEEDDEEDDEDEDSNEQDRPADAGKKVRCDNGKTCLCRKPADEHPGHRWVISKAGWQKYVGARIMCNLREPELFDMYTFNDHAGYGVLEVVQNLLLDYDEMKPSWRDQWAVCEAMVQLCMGSSMTPMTILICRMFLNMLVTLDNASLLKPNSKVQSLPAVMAQYMQLSTGWEKDGFMGEDDHLATRFAGYVCAYAAKHGIQLPLTDKELAKAEEVQLPPQVNVRDPWLWSGTLQKYSGKHAKSHSPRQKGRIGGDSLDLTTWSSAERKAHSFEKKDPLGKEIMNAIKKGEVLQVG